MLPIRRFAIVVAASILGACRSTPVPAPQAGPRFVAPATIVVAPDSGVEKLPGADGKPMFARYPESERNKGTEAWPVIAYVVDTTGAIELRTLTFLAPVPPMAFRQSL